jgi:DNA-binding response OmpR family regulator
VVVSGSQPILVADDSTTILAMVSSRLERAGFDVVTATRGDEALALARQLRPRAALLDVEMPGLDGMEVARGIRSDPELAKTLIVLLTARDRPEDVEAGMAAGADAYLTKPFSPQELEATIDRLLGRR